MISSVFEEYERQYCEISCKLSADCTSAGDLHGEQRKQKISEIKAGLEDADALIHKMDLEARSLQSNLNARLSAKLRKYKSDLNSLKGEVKRMTSASARAARNELLEAGPGDIKLMAADQKGRLLTSTERLNQSSNRIKESRRTMIETEELGASILKDLHGQRQSILHAHETLHEVDHTVDRSRKILTAMSSRMDRIRSLIWQDNQ